MKVLNELKFQVVIIILIFHSCVGQERKKADEIIDPIEIVPFDIRRDSIFLPLPDSLTAKNVTGLAALEIFINRTGKVEGFNIIRFSLMLKKEVLINFFESSSMNIKDKGSYPEQMQPYYLLLTDYVENIEIVKRQEVIPKEINRLTILVRFK